MRLAVIGSGRMGSALGQLWAARGHEVAFSYSRDQRKLAGLARKAGKSARASSPADAVRDSDVVLVAVPWDRLTDALAAAGPVSGKVVVTCTLPMTPDDSDLAVAHTSSGAEELARRAPGARVVAAFNSVTSELLVHYLEHGLPPEGARPSLIYCGDDSAAKARVVQLIADAGFEPVDAGPLQVSRYLEPFGLLVAALAYDQELGPELGYRIVRPE